MPKPLVPIAWPSWRPAAAALLLLSSGGVAAEPPAAPPKPTTIAVFPFELRDASAAGGITPPDARDLGYLAQATEEAKRLLAETGRYALVDTAAAAQKNLAGCDRCEGPIAQRLGASQALLGLVTRVNRTEYTLQIRIIDAGSKATVSNSFTGLRLGANYAWPRGVTWLMTNQILARPGE